MLEITNDGAMALMLITPRNRQQSQVCTRQLMDVQMPVMDALPVLRA